MSDKAQVFISYRREETQHIAGRLADRLIAQMPEIGVFMDVDTIAPGDDFGYSVSHAVAASRVLIAVIGPRWLSIADTQGLRRLDEQSDWVRLEIAVALEQNVRVIPVLVDGASMPRSHDLPESLRNLAGRTAVRVDHETFSMDVNRLIEAVQSNLTPVPPAETRAPRALPPDVDTTSIPTHRSAIRITLWWAAFAFGLVAAGFLGATIKNPLDSAYIWVFFLLSAPTLVALILIRREVRVERSLYEKYQERIGVALPPPVFLTQERHRWTLFALVVAMAMTMTILIVTS